MQLMALKHVGTFGVYAYTHTQASVQTIRISAHVGRLRLRTELQTCVCVWRKKYKV